MTVNLNRSPRGNARYSTIAIAAIACLICPSQAYGQRIAYSFVSPLDNIDPASYTGIPNGTYSTVWHGNYRSGIEGTGMHPGVDIRKPSGTPVKATAVGTVISVLRDWNPVGTQRQRSGWGNHVVIAHQLPDGTTIFSVYAHLRAVDGIIASSVSVEAGQQVGEVGNTGNVISTGGGGFHLHFQIDRDSGSGHPYWIAAVNSKPPSNILNDGVLTRTINPMPFLRQHPPNFEPTAGFTMRVSGTPTSTCLPPNCAFSGQTLNVTVPAGGTALVDVAAEDCSPGPGPGCSYDPDGRISSRAWTLDGQSRNSLGDTLLTELAAGTHTVTLKVIDDAGGQSMVVSGTIVVHEATLGTANWSTYQHDASRSGRSSNLGPVLPHEVWSINLPIASSGAAVGPDHKLWQAVSYPGPTRAFKLQAFWPDGRPAVDNGPFQQDPGPISFRPDGGLYVAARARIYSFMADGEFEWFVDTVDPGPSSLAVRADGSFVVSIRDTFCGSEVVSFYRNGTPQWRVPFGCHGVTTPAFTPDGDVVVADTSLFGLVHRLDGLTGQIKWSQETSLPGPPSVGATGRVFFVEGTDTRSPDSPARLVALNPDGARAWQSAVFGVSLHSPVSIHDDGGVSVVTTDFFSSSMATLRRFQSDGTPSWTRTLVPVTSGTPIVLIDGVGHVFVSLEQNTNADPPVALIQAFDPSGQPLWSHDGRFVSWSIIGDDGSLYTAIVDGLGYRIIAFKD